MQKIVGVKFKGNSKIYYFDPNDIEFELNDNVIVETVNGLEFGQIKIKNKEISDNEIKSPLKPALRKATDEDEKQYLEIVSKESYAFKRALEIINEQNIEMKLVSAEYTFDGKKVIFSYTADGRIDFRNLVKVLASAFHVRIEMRQISGRDDIKYRGALAPCGRSCCCGSFLNDFDKVTLKMAKCQNLSLNPTKINGMCGRLMCCLKFENDFYCDQAKKMPNNHSEVKTPDGIGIVVESNIFKDTVKVRLNLEDITEIKEYPLSELSFKCNKHNIVENVEQEDIPNE